MPTVLCQYLSMEIWLTQKEKRGQREDGLNRGRWQVQMSDSLNGTSPFTTPLTSFYGLDLNPHSSQPCRVKLIAVDIILLLPFSNSREAMCFLFHLTPQRMNTGWSVSKFRLAATCRVFVSEINKTR